MGALTMAMFVSLSTTGLNPVETVAVDRVDLIEINHYYDEKGRHVLDQVIFYDWSPEDGRYQVRDWRMLKRASQVPYRDNRTRDYVAIWHDAHDGEILRRVTAKALRESWTQYDPEIAERDHLAKEKRRKLLKFVKVKADPRPTSPAEPVSPSASQGVTPAGISGAGRATNGGP